MAESSSSSSSAAEKVAANSDLLIEILIRLPIRSLQICKSVSKPWLSIITSHVFALLHNPESTIVSGLFLHPYSTNPFPDLNYIPLIHTIKTPNDDPYHRFKDLSFFPGLPACIRIINSCHGLLLCCFGFNHDNNPEEPNYFILNPTTKRFKILPKLHISNLVCLTLAFDPSRPPHYKVVCLYYTDFVPTYPAGPYHHIMVYSSETGSWKASGVPFTAKYKNQYDTGVYWNGAVNWFNNSGIGDSEYYNVGEERLGIIPLPPIPEGNDWNNREFRHYGESRGHLHLIEMYDRMHQVDVYELERDYSGWYLKFCFDLDVVGILRDSRLFPFSILCVVRMERDDESFLVLHIPGKLFLNTRKYIPGKLLRYIFRDGTLKKICDVAIPMRFHNGGFSIESRLGYSWSSSFPYIESLFGV